MSRGGPGRKRRKGLPPTVVVNCRMQAEVRDLANANADALGISMGRYVQMLIERDQLDSDGRPLWAAEVFPDLADPIPGLERWNAA